MLNDLKAFGAGMSDAFSAVLRILAHDWVFWPCSIAGVACFAYGMFGMLAIEWMKWWGIKEAAANHGPINHVLLSTIVACLCGMVCLARPAVSAAVTGKALERSNPCTQEP